MVFLSSSTHTRAEIESQKRGGGANATAETGLVTTPPPQQQQQKLPLSTGTCKADETFAAKRHVGAHAHGESTQPSLRPPITPVSEMIAASAMGSELRVNGDGADATMLPLYPYRASSSHKPGCVSLLEKTGVDQEQRKVGGGEDEVLMMDVAP